MLDIDNLSYKAYGILMIVLLLILAILFNIWPYDAVGFAICIFQIPLYLISRALMTEPIHACGLDICCVVTLIFYALLFAVVKIFLLLIDVPLAFSFTCLLTALGCYFTSTKPNQMQILGKIFFGYKKHEESKYNRLIEYIKFNGIEPKLLDAENRLKELDTQTYLIYKRKFREDKTFKEMVEEFDIDNPRIVEILDKAYFYMIGALKI